MRSVVVFLSAGLTLLSVCGSTAQATFAGNGGKVTLQSSRDGDNEIYTVPAYTGTVTQLTSNTASDVDPAWSPNGLKIAFASTRDGDPEVWMMDADGTNQEQLTFNGIFDGMPAWSPDGLKIAFVSDRDGDREIFTMSATPGALDVAQLTESPAADIDPAWGAANFCPPACVAETRIAFTSGRDGNDEIYVMDEDGDGETNLSSNPADDRLANWSPCANSPAIVFASERDGNSEIYRMAANGSGQARLTTDVAEDTAPAWSPRCHAVAFERVAGDSEIFSISSPDLAPSAPFNWTNAPTNERRPDWQPTFEPPPANFGHLRPKGATPLRASLVVAYPPCTAPDRTHGPPLGFASCAAPTPASLNLNVGNPVADGSGASANMIGSIRLGVLVGAVGLPDDSDVAIAASITDVRCDARQVTSPTFPCGPQNAIQQNDYVGQVQGSVAVRVTDRWNAAAAGGGTNAATVTDFPWEFAIDCMSTASTTTGGTCATNTSFNALAPGSVRDAKRAVWQMDEIRVYDAGADGTVTGPPDGRTLFAVQGLFVP